MKKLIVVFSSGVFISMAACSGNSNPNATTQEVIQQEEIIVDVNVNQFKELIVTHGGTILDVRTPEEWAEGTIAKAEKIDYYSDNFATGIERLNKSEPIFIYCKKGGRSSSAAEILEEKGFTKVYNLDGGITAWIDAGNEILK